MFPTRFSIFGSGRSNDADNLKNRPSPTLKLHTDKDVYRPGDSIFVTIEICNPKVDSGNENVTSSLLIERLGFEIRGIEKLDTQWFATQKSLPGSKQKKGEHIFMDCTTPCVISNQILSSGATKTYIVRTILPSILPPSYKGATIRYLYYVKTSLSGQWLILEDGHSDKETTEDLAKVETRVPLQIWVTQNSNGLPMEETLSDGIVPSTTIQLELYWKEMDGDSEWTRANDLYDGVEEGYDSSRDEVSSVSSYNPNRESISKAFGSSLSLQSTIARSSSRDAHFFEGERTSLSLNLPRLSVAEVLYDYNSADPMSSNKAETNFASSQQQKLKMPLSGNDTASPSSATGKRLIESEASEGFIRGRSYNIRMDDQVLLRFSPRNSDSTYYFSDMIGGTLTFFHEEGARRCLEVSITLVTSETVNRRYVHPSRRSSPVITKIQSDHHEVVADLLQTSFIFSVPMDGPMSFSTPHVAVQWALRFEFFTTPKNVDLSRYEHPLLIEGRDKSEWVLPITVHSPPAGAPTTRTRDDKPFSSEPLWVHTGL